MKEGKFVSCVMLETHCRVRRERMAAFLLTPRSPGAVSYWLGAAWSKTAAGWAPDGINKCVSLCPANSGTTCHNP